MGTKLRCSKELTQVQPDKTGYYKGVRMNIVDQTAIAEKEALYWVQQAEALERLERNDDFKKVVLEGYLKERALRSVSLLAHDGTKRAGARPDVMETLIAISSLEDHFHVIKQLGGMAKDDLADEVEDDVDESTEE